MNCNPKINFSGGNQGWIGDNPIIQVDPKFIESLGWTANYNIKTSIEDTVEWLLDNKWCFEHRD